MQAMACAKDFDLRQLIFGRRFKSLRKMRRERKSASVRQLDDNTA
jgi:hypothetical protein